MSLMLLAEKDLWQQYQSLVARIWLDGNGPVQRCSMSRCRILCRHKRDSREVVIGWKSWEGGAPSRRRKGDRTVDYWRSGDLIREERLRQELYSQWRKSQAV